MIDMYNQVPANQQDEFFVVTEVSLKANALGRTSVVFVYEDVTKLRIAMAFNSIF